MKILVLHQHFKTPETGGAIRSWFLVEALIQAGHTVTVITADHSGRSFIAQHGGAQIHYLPVPYNNAFGFLKRVLAFFQFAWLAARRGRTISFDVCYAISAPLTTGLTARWLQLTCKRPYYFEVGDLWPDAPIGLKVLRNKLLITASKWMEYHIYRHADKIIALSPAIQKTIQQRAPGKPVIMIPNMADISYFGQTPYPSIEKPFTILYAGAMGFANGLEYMIDCARVCDSRNLPIRYVLCGDGAMTQALVARSAGLSNVVFHSPRKRDAVRELLAEADAVMICYQPVAVLETGSPNKFFDALAAGRMVIVNFGGWISELIRDHQCGVYVSPSSPDQFANTIEPYLMNRSLARQAGSQAAKLALDFDRRKLAAEFTSLFSASSSQGSYLGR